MLKILFFKIAFTIYLTENYLTTGVSQIVDKYDLDGNRVATRDIAFSFRTTYPRMSSIAVNSSAVYITVYTVNSGNDIFRMLIKMI